MQRAALKKKDHLPEEDVLAKWNQGECCLSLGQPSGAVR